MKRIIAISGSASEHSSNTKFLHSIANGFADSFNIQILEGLSKLPLYTPQLEERAIPENVSEFRRTVADADAVIISTPEYLHNIPAVLKNALEWMTTSGELADKPVLPITFTPAHPRGEYAMKSLLQSLTASKAKIVTELGLHRNQLVNDQGDFQLDGEYSLLISEALKLL